VIYATTDPQPCPEWCGLTEHLRDDKGIIHEGIVWALNGDPQSLSVRLSGGTDLDGNVTSAALSVGPHAAGTSWPAIHDIVDARAFALAVADAAEYVTTSRRLRVPR
jgi:hypothetical protein